MVYTDAVSSGGNRVSRLHWRLIVIVASSERLGVLLVNTGTPSEPTPKAVREYLAKFLMDPCIVPMNKVCWWLILHICILPSRGRKSAAKYEKIWTEEGSPLDVAHRGIQEKLSRALDEAGVDAVLRCGMSYSSPSVRECLEEMRAAGCARLVVLPLYPQSAYSTVGAVHGVFDRAMTEMRWQLPIDFIDNYHDDPVYLRSIADGIRAAGFDADSDDRLLFAFHSVPLVDIDNGDTYELQVDASCKAIAEQLGIGKGCYDIGYQCRFDKGREWLSPYVDEVLARLAETGTGRLFYVCPNFSVDCLETLYDVEYEHKPRYLEALRAAGVQPTEESSIYVPCLNDSPAQIETLYHVLEPHLR